MTSRVFITQDDGRLNFSDAKRFGELHRIVGRDVFPDDADERAKVMQDIVRAKLSDFQPQNDWILLAGDPVTISAVSLFLGSAFPEDAVRYLKYDGEAKAYYPVTLE